jgi:hypothetical protein
MTALPLSLRVSESSAPAFTIRDCCLELRWTVRVAGRAAAMHTLSSNGERGSMLITGEALPAWSSARPLAPDLRWSTSVRPRVLRHDDRAAGLEIDCTAPAISIHERGVDSDGVQLEHEAIVLADFVAFAQPWLEATRRLAPPARLWPRAAG